MINVIRPTWQAANDEQKRLLRAAEKAARDADRLRKAAAEAEAATWAAILAARDADVPDTLLCERTGRSRATLNRKFGARP